MNRQKFLERLIVNRQNVNYNDFVNLIESYGFKRTRGKGSHSIYKRKDIPQTVNIQNQGGEAKPYQIAQFLSLVEQYNLELGDR